jgi:N-acetylmuramoyl-L-alanine amidase
VLTSTALRKTGNYFVKLAFVIPVTIILASSLLVSCTSPRVTKIQSHNYGDRVKSLVLHFTAINYADSVTALVDEGGLSAHYLIPESNDPSDPDGSPRIIQLVDEDKRAWHAGKSYWQGRTGLNDHSIGVEIVNVPECQWDNELGPTKQEHGSNRLCIFPDYDPQQIEVVIKLAQGILARHPDIHPTAVIGHSDIAFNRKNDPGPRFPWFELYQAGIGAWYENDTLGEYWLQFNEQLPSIGLVQAALRSYGYGVIETGVHDEATLNAITAFQMHFLPWHINSQADSQTAAAVFALLERYFPDKAQTLMARYQRENENHYQEPVVTKRGQVDALFPDPEPSERELVNDKYAFKAYKGRGNIHIQSDTAVSANIQINGQQLNIEQPFSPLKSYQYSLAKRTQNGINTLAVSDILPADSQLRISIPFPTLEDKTTQYSERFAAVDNLITQDVEQGFPGAVLLVVKDGAIIKRSAYGYAKRYDAEGRPLAQPTPMTVDTGFDLASNTKMFATTMALMHLVQEGKLDVTQPIQTYLPEYQGNGREGRRVKDLLSHQSGYEPQIKFYNPENPLGSRFFSQDKAKTSQLLITQAPFKVGNGLHAAYSDTNFMLLGLIIERITGMPLDVYCEETLYAPLGLTNTLFNPLHKGRTADQFAATELAGNTRGGRISFPNIREYTLQGEVHDEKAFYSMQGVAGHAGLFSTADDMAVMAQLLLNGGGYDEVNLFDSSILNTFIKPDARFWSYGLGWRRPNNGTNRWHFGPYASAQAYGHTGWTGTVTVIDPALDLAIILLTNARHSPIVEDEEGEIVFTGKEFETGKYGSVVALVYEALLNQPNTQ